MRVFGNQAVPCNAGMESRGGLWIRRVRNPTTERRRGESIGSGCRRATEGCASEEKPQQNRVAGHPEQQPRSAARRDVPRIGLQGESSWSRALDAIPCRGQPLKAILVRQRACCGCSSDARDHRVVLRSPIPLSTAASHREPVRSRHDLGFSGEPVTSGWDVRTGSETFASTAARTAGVGFRRVRG